MYLWVPSFIPLASFSFHDFKSSSVFGRSIIF
jgi:hypothetical protein